MEENSENPTTVKEEQSFIPKDLSLDELKALEANLARVQFSPAVVKDIVSPHMGSILAKDGPIVPLSDSLREKALHVFNCSKPTAIVDPVAVAPVAAPGKAGKSAPAPAPVVDPLPILIDAQAKEWRMPYSSLAKALFQCGVTPVDISTLAESTQAGTEEAKNINSSTSVNSSLSTQDRLARLIALYSQDNDLGPSQTLSEEGFLTFVSRFHAPAFHYGQRMRRATGRGCTNDVLELLLRGTDVNTADGEGLTLLHYASEFNRGSLIQAVASLCGSHLMVNPRCKAGWTPLYTACHHNNIDVVKLLLTLGADTKLTTIYGKSPLHAAAGRGFVSIVQVLLDAGADGKMQCSAGMTPLHDAAYKEQVACYELLLVHPSVDSSQKETLKYTAEQLLHGTTGTNVGGVMSYGGSTVAAASVGSAVETGSVMSHERA